MCNLHTFLCNSSDSTDTSDRSDSSDSSDISDSSDKILHHFFVCNFFVLRYWVNVSLAMVQMLISREIVDGN